MTAELQTHHLRVALLQPQIAPNTGNIARLCVATNTELHLVRPMGFILSDRELKRSAMDYWPRLRFTLHDDTQSFFQYLANDRFWLFTSKSNRSHWQADYRDGDCLIFGSETSGIPNSLLNQHESKTVRIPQAAGERCLNVSTAAGVGLFEALRKVQSL